MYCKLLIGRSINNLQNTEDNLHLIKRIKLSVSHFENQLSGP